MLRILPTTRTTRFAIKKYFSFRSNRKKKKQKQQIFFFFLFSNVRHNLLLRISWEAHQRGSLVDHEGMGFAKPSVRSSHFPCFFIVVGFLPLSLTFLQATKKCCGFYDDTQNRNSTVI